jgi:hypothetical protein
MPTPFDIAQAIQLAVECSVYLAPTEPGLSWDELVEACGRLGFRPGEISDQLQFSGVQSFIGHQRMLPSQQTRTSWSMFAIHTDPDYRNVQAFDFIGGTLNELARDVGTGRAQIDRKVLIERGRAQGLPELDLQAAVTILTLSEQLAETDGVLSLARNRTALPIFCEQQRPQDRPVYAPLREKAFAAVKDIIERRSDGRPQHPEPLDAFAGRLAELGHGAFRVWWVQMVAELRRSDPQASPVSVLVLSAALVEGALAFVVRHARGLDVSIFKSTDFDKPPRTWKIEDLVKSAAQGPDAILDHTALGRVTGLVSTRQRIHAGRMLEEYPRGVPDLRPEEARDGRSTAELCVRRILDWLEHHPRGASPE